MTKHTTSDNQHSFNSKHVQVIGSMSQAEAERQVLLKLQSEKIDVSQSIRMNLVKQMVRASAAFERCRINETVSINSSKQSIRSFTKYLVRASGKMKSNLND